MLGSKRLENKGNGVVRNSGKLKKKKTEKEGCRHSFKIIKQTSKWKTNLDRNQSSKNGSCTSDLGKKSIYKKQVSKNKTK